MRERVRAWRKALPGPRQAGRDGLAGTVLGVESVPDGLASGLLAGVNPLSGLYGYMFGTLGGALFTSTPLMAVQATGAMALVVADAGLSDYSDPERALFTLSMLTGVVMVIAGLVGAGRLLRFVPSSVMTGFIAAVGVNIVLGQLGNLTGYDAPGGNRIARTLELVTHPGRMDAPTVVTGAVTLVAILLLTRTRFGATGMVVAVAAGSVLAAIWSQHGATIVTVGDLAELPSGLPGPIMPALGDVTRLMVPAVSLAFVGLVQGSAVSAAYPPPGGQRVETSRDFIGQGAGNLLAGLFQGMPVGGSMSATALVARAGARSRLALVVAGAVMAVVVVAFGGVVGRVAMPSLAALLITVGVAAVKPRQLRSVAKTGVVQAAVTSITFALTLVVPLQYSVLTGVGLAVLLHIVQQSNKMVLRELLPTDDGWLERDAPTMVAGRSVTVLQPYGSLFFASAAALEAQLPDPAGADRSVVIVRLRGFDELGRTVVDVLHSYALRLVRHGSRLVLVVTSDRVVRQFQAAGMLDTIGEEGIYRGSDLLGRATGAAVADATAWVADSPEDVGTC